MSESKYINNVIAKAKKLYKTIVLPEGEDARIREAAHLINKEKIAKIILLGDENTIRKEFAANNWDLEGIELINPETSAKLAEYTELLYNLRKEKGLSHEDAEKLAKSGNYFGTLMVKSGHADGMVSGANHSTADTVRPALQIIKSSRKDRGVSSAFIMVANNKTYFFADCAITINPNDKELADIALQTADSMIQFGEEPRIALLSYSTYGSGKGESVDKVHNAAILAKAALQTPEYAGKNIHIDGEMQADAALDITVGQFKAKGSDVAGYANGLIFPDINSGNIAYKILQRLGGVEAYGPILQGLNAPINDLSRGCVTVDIIGLVALTSLQTVK